MSEQDRAARIEAYGGAYELLTEALKRYPREMWEYRSPEEGWSIHEIVVHIADSEANSFVRCRRLIAEPGSTVLGYDESGWAQALHYTEQSTDDALQLFRWLRNNSYKLIQTLPDAVWSNTVEHTENGIMTMDDWLHVYERHVPEHIAQMERIYASWRG